MSKQEKLLWQDEETSAPLPPLADMPNKGDEIQGYIELYRKLGPVFRISRPELQPQIILIGPEANAFVAGHWEKFFVSSEFWQDFGKAMGNEQGTEFTGARDGEANRLRRAREGRCYSRTKVLDQIGRMQEIVYEQIQLWPQQQNIALLSTIQRITAEQLGQLLVHHEVGDYMPDILTYLYTSFENAVAVKNMAAFLEPAFVHAKERTQELARAILVEHRVQSAQRSQPDLLDDVLLDAAEHPDEYTEAKLERAALKPFLLGIMTVAHTSSFMLYQLLNNQELLRRVLAEVDETLAEGPLTWEKLKRLQTVYGATMETLRMANESNRHTLRVARPLTLAGYRLNVGDVVLVVSGAAHRLPELFPEPDIFDVDRYHVPRNEHRQSGAFVPFGLGNHICLGSSIAEIQLICTTATILHRYQLAIDPPDYQLTKSDNPLSPAMRQLHINVVAER